MGDPEWCEACGKMIRCGCTEPTNEYEPILGTFDPKVHKRRLPGTTLTVLTREEARALLWDLEESYVPEGGVSQVDLDIGIVKLRRIAEDSNPTPRTDSGGSDD